MSRKPSGTPDEASPDKTTTSKSGYAEKHGPRSDPDGWGEENARRSQRPGTSEGPNQGQAAGARSFDHGPDDTAAADAAEAADDASRREPGERGADDAKQKPVSPGAAAADAAHATTTGQPHQADNATPPGFSQHGSQRDYGQGGGQGYLHTGKPGAPDPGGKPD